MSCQRWSLIPLVFNSQKVTAIKTPVSQRWSLIPLVFNSQKVTAIKTRSGSDGRLSERGHPVSCQRWSLIPLVFNSQKVTAIKTRSGSDGQPDFRRSLGVPVCLLPFVLPVYPVVSLFGMPPFILVPVKKDFSRLAGHGPSFTCGCPQKTNIKPGEGFSVITK